MSAPILWIIIPLLCGAFLTLFAEKRRFCAVTALLLCFVLVLIAVFIPVNSMIVFSNKSIIFTSSMELLGRRLVLEREQQAMMAFFYLFAAIWIMGTFFTDVNRYFVPIVLMDTALWISVLAIKPFVFGAFMVMLSVLITVPVMWSQRTGSGKGILRFLLYQMLGMICLVIGGWMASNTDANATDNQLVTRTVVMIFLGFSFWLAIFPFFDWIAVLMDSTSVYFSGFIISLLQFSSLSILLNFLDSYLWLRTNETFYQGLILTGLIMMIVGSLWACFQKSLSRVMAFAIVAENGAAMVLLGLKSSDSVRIFLSSLFINILSTLLWSISAKDLSQETDLSLDHLKGLFYAKPYICLALLVSFFSAAGLPLLAGFPLKLSLIAACFKKSAQAGWLTSIGSFLLLFAGFRLAVVFIFEKGCSFSREPRGQRIFLIVGMLILVFLTVYPAAFSDFIARLQTQFVGISGG